MFNYHLTPFINHGWCCSTIVNLLFSKSTMLYKWQSWFTKINHTQIIIVTHAYVWSIFIYVSTLFNYYLFFIIIIIIIKNCSHIFQSVHSNTITFSILYSNKYSIRLKCSTVPWFIVWICLEISSTASTLSSCVDFFQFHHVKWRKRYI